MISKQTLKTKTFWGCIAWGIVQTLHILGVIDGGAYEAANTVIVTLTGVAARDALTKKAERP